ncbi:hypothetical protein [Magnetococcus sp. PR-3]|uniref:hypothetical protein n=1 Tax=Magnetococcus sp. PR-3 TaxID=3120355 RepID=UPI002FCE466B
MSYHKKRDDFIVYPKEDFPNVPDAATMMYGTDEEVDRAWHELNPGAVKRRRPQQSLLGRRPHTHHAGPAMIMASGPVINTNERYVNPGIPDHRPCFAGPNCKPAPTVPGNGNDSGRSGGWGNPNIGDYAKSGRYGAGPAGRPKHGKTPFPKPKPGKGEGGGKPCGNVYDCWEKGETSIQKWFK